MQKCIILLLALLFATPAKADMVITNDRGGNVLNYAWWYYWRANTPKIIDGYCASSCTIALGYPNTCVTPHAKLGFHSAYYVTIFGHEFDPTDTKILWSYYPEKVRQWIDGKGGLTPDLKYLEGDEMLAILPNC